MTAEECVKSLCDIGYRAEIDEDGLPILLLSKEQYRMGWQKYNTIIHSTGWKGGWVMTEIKDGDVK